MQPPECLFGEIGDASFVPLEWSAVFAGNEGVEQGNGVFGERFEGSDRILHLALGCGGHNANKGPVPPAFEQGV